MRNITTLIVITALLFQTVSCAVRRLQYFEPSEMESPFREEVVALILRNGTEVSLDYGRRPFDPTVPASMRQQTPRYLRTRVVGDSLHSTVLGRPVSFALDDIERIWVRRIDAAASVVATIGSAIGISLGLSLIALMMKESCPFIYSWDGTQYVFDAEPYGGATTKGLERDDYSEMEHIKAVEGEYRLLVTNEVNETQYTNLTEMWVVDHPEGTRVAADVLGNIHTLTEIRKPISARDRMGKDLLRWLESTDRIVWEPEPVPDSEGNLYQDIELTFPRPPGTSEVKLVANIATGLWGSHMIRAILELQGRNVGVQYAALDSDPEAVESLMAWIENEELFVLKVLVEEPAGWEVRGLLPGGGPFISEDRVLPLDISRVEGDELRIKLRPPVGFWALNSFGVDYSTDQEVLIKKILPSEALTSAGEDVLADLVAPDDRYHVMPRTGDRTMLKFPAVPERPGMNRTVFMHSRGYYKLHLEETGPPNLAAFLRLLNEPGAAARMSAELYKEWKAAGSKRP